MLKVSPWKSTIRFGKRGKLNPRYIGPFEITQRIGPVTYRLKLPQELQLVHDVFHVSTLKKCLSDETLIIPLEELRLVEKMNFVEGPIEIVGHDAKQCDRVESPSLKYAGVPSAVITSLGNERTK